MNNAMVILQSLVVVALIALSANNNARVSAGAPQLDALYPPMPIQDLLNGHFEPLDDSDASAYYGDYRVRKDDGDEADNLNRYRFATRNDILLANEPSPRKEYLEPSSLMGHQYVQGGAGEGSQHLKPDGSIPNVQVIKSDSILPAYCNPPNPCPQGYSAAQDGCTDNFENSAPFSKDYQAAQECMCDTEHMFNCPGTTGEDALETLARSLTNENLVEPSLDRIIDDIEPGLEKAAAAKAPFGHKVVAKKFFDDSKHRISKRSVKKSESTAKKSTAKNPFLRGEKLRVVAKKSPHLAKN